MKKVTNFIVNNSNIILIIFIIVTCICLYTSTKVNVNSDISKYLPNDSETKIGNEIMESEFEEQKSCNLNIMFKDLSDDDKQNIYEKLKKIHGVSSVDYDNTEEYNKGKYTLYTLNVDDYDHSKTAEDVYNEVKNNYDYKAMSGSINSQYKPILQMWIMVVAVIMALIILTILSDSYIEPWLYLGSIGIAVFINKGTNIMFSSVSSITNAIAAILQLALSMDYSIMLSNRYRQERAKEKDKTKAMKTALYDSFKAISSSSVTTVVGLLALVFMSFTIGKDLGFVLAKGVFLSLVSIFFCLPGLILIFDKQIIYSKKKTINFNLTKLGNLIYKIRIGQVIFIVVLFIASLFLKSNLGVLFTGSEQNEVGKIFPATNQIAIVYENKYEDIISSYCKEISKDKKVDEVLCYGNTINEKLAYDELNNKLKELGQDANIDDYLIKIIYYNYYSKNNEDKMTLEEFIKFIKSDIYTNSKVSESIDENVKNNINLLENFSNKNNIYKKRTTKEISSILGINQKDADDILVYYNSKHLNTKMTIKEFVNFILNEVASSPDYSSNLDSKTISSLKQLTPFIDTNIINKEMTSTEISSTFGIDKNTVDQLFLFYRTTQDSKTTLTINEFVSFALELKNNPSYSNMFTQEVINKLTLLQTLTKEEFINQKHTSNELSQILSSMGINALDNQTISLLYFYNYYLNNVSNEGYINEGYITETKLSLNEFVNEVIMDNNINSLLPSSINNYIPILKTFSNKTFITTELNRIEMSNYLKPFGFEEIQINMIYASIYKTINPIASDEEAMTNTIVKLTPYQIMEIIKSSLPVDNPKYQEISLLINIMNLSYNKDYNIVPTYDYQTLSNYLSTISNDINVSTISLGYAYYDYKNNNENTMSIKEVINFIVINKDNQLISSKLNNDTSELLSLVYMIINNIDKKYSYKEIAALTNQPESTIKSIYGVLDYNTLKTTLSPKNFVDLILNNQKNPLLSSKLNTDTLKTLTLVKTVMNSTLNNTKYTSKELSNILGTNEETISLVASLYNSKHIKSNLTISLLDFTNFINSDIIPNKKYSSKINEESQNKLKTVTALMKNTISNTKYNSLELFDILNKLSRGVEYNLIDLVYIYHGSKNEYDDSWKLTVEEIINYVCDYMLNDQKYSNFIDSKMSTKLKLSRSKIVASKKLLVTSKYSRAVINSKYGAEDEDTFDFINKLKNDVGKNDGIYVIGDSPMALEMTLSFNDELNYITILTMIFIFVVVAFTFRDLLTPLILVLVIQCAVSVTMAILSLTGSSVYFISILIVQAILMGATIDYAIVYTTYYKEERDKVDVKNAVINAYNKSIHTIISSASILIIVTLIVSVFSEAIPAKICETISQGTLCSAILILFVLPGILATCDKFIYKPKKVVKKTTKKVKA